MPAGIIVNRCVEAAIVKTADGTVTVFVKGQPMDVQQFAKWLEEFAR